MKIQNPIIFVLLLLAACQPSQRILEDGKRNATPEPAANSTVGEKHDDFEERLKSVQTGNFQYVYVFRRKDGEIFDGEDKRYLRTNSPSDTNQWVLTADQKAVIAGSNYAFTPENLENLKNRFAVADYSSIMNGSKQ